MIKALSTFQSAACVTPTLGGDKAADTIDTKYKKKTREVKNRTKHIIIFKIQMFSSIREYNYHFDFSNKIHAVTKVRSHSKTC